MTGMTESHFEGKAVSDGIAIARPFVYSRHDERGSRGTGVAEDPVSRLEKGLSAAAAYLTRLMEMPGISTESEEIFGAQILMIEDPTIIDQCRTAIASGMSVEDSVDKAFSEAAGKLQSVDDPYISARAADIRDVKLVVLSELKGGTRSLREMLSASSGPVAVIADEILPTDTAGITTSNVAAFVTKSGGGNSHAAIIAKKLSIPAVFSVRDFPQLLKQAAGSDTVIVDGNRGEVILNPGIETVESYLSEKSSESAGASGVMSSAFSKACTTDGVEIEVEANMADIGELDAVVRSGADGVGLFRTEFMLIGRASMPTEEEQFSVYRKAVETLKPKRLIVRTFDIGGDKPLPFIQTEAEANPFLGYRGARMTLDREELIRPQVRAVLRASVSGSIGLMLPMVSVKSEVARFRKIIDEERHELESASVAVGRVEVGIMVEVPSIALTIRSVLNGLDFVSIGTNDLTQYCLAADRNNSTVAALNDHLEPSVICLIHRVAEECSKAGVEAAVCGEMASDAHAIPILIGAGITSLSVTHSYVSRVKEAVRSIDRTFSRGVALKALKSGSAADVRELVERVTGARRA